MRTVKSTLSNCEKSQNIQATPVKHSDFCQWLGKPYKLLQVINWGNLSLNPKQVFDVKSSAKQKFSAWTVHQKIQN